MTRKISKELERSLDASEPDSLVEVIVELHQSAAPEMKGPQTRQEAIAQRREGFEQQARSVEQAIAQLGGEVLGKAWINNTLKVRVPASCVAKISEAEDVDKVDVPHKLEYD